MQSILTEFWDALTFNGLKEFLGFALAALVIGIARRFGLLQKLWKPFHDAWTARNQLERVRQAVDTRGPGIWLTKPILTPERYEPKLARSKPILTLANLKGGVGKTTLAANLVAYFALARRERVLAIDLDYQGSLTSMLVPGPDGRPGRGQASKASRVIAGEADPNWLLDAIAPVTGIQNAKAVTAFYDLAQYENSTMVTWLIGDQTNDVRYNLAEILHSDEVQSNFDRIILDAPPRLTAGCVQALCASTHVLIPTVLDRLSGEAVATFIDQLHKLKPATPSLQILGVVANMTDSRVAHERDALDELKERVEQSGAHTEVFPDGIFVPDRAVLGVHAGQRVFYANSGNSPTERNLKAIFDALGGYIHERMGQ